MGELGTVNVEVRGAVGIVELARPEKLNALNYDVAVELPLAFERVGSDPAVGAVLLCGAGRAFSAGADLKDERVHQGADLIEHLESAADIPQVVAACRKPVVAAVQGYCVAGGLELMLAADVAIAAEDAVFFLSQLALGIIPAAGGISRLAQKIGVSWASRLVLTGERIDARKAEQIGLVTEVVAPERLRERGLELAAAIAAQPREAAYLAKDALASVHDMPLAAALKLDRQRVFPLFTATQR